MRIYSMTATFGKLEQETLTLEPGLNVIQAPNEWGKSTWCAFLTAMLYGLDTRTHSTKTALSDKERYAPWSGAPMSGRIDLHWKGRDITIERKSKGRTVFGDFRAYETESGLSVPELTAQNCGQQLLGVEKTVFTRSALIRQADLPVTQDEALRRRLNALVTTGDDSGAAENLEKKLRDLKNRCRYNRSGLLPQSEAEAEALDRKLRELEALESQSAKLRQQATSLEQYISQLENHRTALAYSAAQENDRLRQKAEAEWQQAEQRLKNFENQCADLPAQSQARQTYLKLQEIQDRWAQFRMDAVTPAVIPGSSLFQGMAPEEAQRKAAADALQYAHFTKSHWAFLILSILLICGGIAAILLAPEFSIYGYGAIGTGILGMAVWAINTTIRRSQARKIANRYGSRDSSQWVAAAEDYANQLRSIAQSQAARHETVAALRQETDALCQRRPLAEAIRHWHGVCAQWDTLEVLRKESHLYREQMMLLPPSKNAPAPEHPDSLTISEVQTRQELSEAARKLREVQHRLGQCQGQMEAIGHRRTLELRRDSVKARICRMEETYTALELAISTLEQARAALQRRFSPRITARAQDILSRLTNGRYDRLVLGSDLTLQATATDEHTLRTALWRSDGTADLLYLALRLAVAGELIPDAPLILDDALVRFDDQRLKQSMAVLKEESGRRQILLFTCHSREQLYM